MTSRPGWNQEVADALEDVGRTLGGRRGHMFGHPALYVGRHLVACAYGDGLGIKLPAHRVRALLDAGRATPFQPYGKAAMAQWAHVPARSGAEVNKLADLLAEAVAHVANGPSS